MVEVPENTVLRDGADILLRDARVMPNAGGFLWNPDMMLQMTCRGYATAQFMQPEPAKYSRSPAMEATSFMQPEHPYFAHHSGRFFYVKDRKSGALFSAPYEPVRNPDQQFEFRSTANSLEWRVRQNDIEISLTVCLPAAGTTEMWHMTVTNLGTSARDLSVYPVFSFGYLSWMNQGGTYDDSLNAIIARYVTPYQKVKDYFKHLDFKDCSFLMADQAPDSWSARLSAFEGEGGLHAPDGIQAARLGREQADYEIPLAALQYDVSLKPGESRNVRLLFGAAKDSAEIAALRTEFLENPAAFDRQAALGRAFVEKGQGVLQVKTGDPTFDHYVNHWMPRQVYYHGTTNRLTTDPQTRNYLQDHMGMCYVNPASMKNAILLALSQQKVNGEMPDGILLHEGASLKYINQVPHTDHTVWLPICLRSYLNESGDFDILWAQLPFADDERPVTLFQHISRAMRWLASNRDERGLNFIAEGDWCDPMNMVGYKGKGVSVWLTLATAYACREWATICRMAGQDEMAANMESLAADCNQSANRHCWDGDWYGRGITDDGRIFGVAADDEGKIFLNPQSWAMLCGAADADKTASMRQAVDKHLMTPYGVMMLGPAYTGMRDDIGRITQKFPGSAENGSVYNHAAAFYAYALYTIGDADAAYDVLKRMLPSDTDYAVRGQLPNYIPNYYRGAYHQYPRTAGRSSQLLNTGTVAWFTRIVTEKLFGLEGVPKGLRIHPAIPSHWNEAQVTRRFRGATFAITYRRLSNTTGMQIQVDGKACPGQVISEIEAGRHYEVEVRLPATERDTE